MILVVKSGRTAPMKMVALPVVEINLLPMAIRKQDIKLLFIVKVTAMGIAGNLGDA